MSTLNTSPSILSAWPHAEGLVRLAYSPSGKYLYTGGSESYIRVFETDADEESDTSDPKLIEYHTEAINSIDCSAEYMCSCEDDGSVAIHAHESNELVSLISRSSIPARSARFDPRGKRLAITSDELIVKIIDVQDPLKVQLLAGHSKAVRSATWSPNGNYLATSSVDGTIRIWDLGSGPEPSCVKVIEGLICIDQPESYFSAQAVWHPSGAYFVVPSRSHEIVVVSQENGWAQESVFSDSKDGHTSEISALTFSSNGAYLASCGKEGSIIVWDSSTRRIVTRCTQSNGIVSDVAFRPAPSTANELAYADVSGQMTRWLSVIPSHLTGPSSTSKNASKLEKRNGEAIDAVEEDDDDDDDDDMRAAREGAANDWIDDDLGLDEGGKNNGYKDLRSKMGWEKARGDYGAFGTVAKRSGPLSTAQGAFQPGSTSFRENRKYLAFNMIGYIHALERDDRNIVTIEFHDSTTRQGTHFDDFDKCTLGALGDLGSVFSAPPTSTSPCIIFYKPYVSWTTPHPWSYSLPAGEDAVALAISAPPSSADLSSAYDDDSPSSGSIVVGTSKGYLRFLTGSGVQKYLWQLGGEIVAMSSGKELLIVLHRDASENGLEYTVLDLESYEVLQAGKVPVTVSGGTICWLGFTEDDIPSIYNSEGIVSLLDRSRRPRQARWVPALDTSTMSRKVKNNQESYWPIGISAEYVHVIVLKGSETAPHFPTPLVQELILQFPLMRLDSSQGLLEEQYLRETLFVSHRRDGCPATDYTQLSSISRSELATDKSLLKLIQLLCKAEHLSAALDVVLLLTQPASLDAAGKIAAFFRLPPLEERIEAVKEGKTGMARRDREEGEKRDAKWSHLVDLRTVVGSSSSSSFNPSMMQLQSNNGNFASSAASGRQRLALDSPAPSSIGGSAGGFLGSKSKRRSVTGAHIESTLYTSDGDAQGDDSMHLDGDGAFDRERSIGYEEGEGDEYGDSDRAAKRMRGSSAGIADQSNEYREDEYGEQEQEEELEYADRVPVPAAKPHNPFAKRLQPPKPDKAVPPPVNPFASKSKTNGNAKNLTRTGSFFNRVEGTEPSEGRSTAVSTNQAKSKAPSTSKASAATTVPGGRQTTLFGLAPGEAKVKEKKKRGAADTENNDGDGSEKKQSSMRDALGKMQKKKMPVELPREGEEFEETQMEEETQTEETQIAKRGREQEALDAADADQDEEDGASKGGLEEAQVDEGEMTESVESTNAEVPMGGSGISKLAQFRLAA